VSVVLPLVDDVGDAVRVGVGDIDSLVVRIPVGDGSATQLEFVFDTHVVWIRCHP